jgi:urease subunit gamma/beta
MDGYAQRFACTGVIARWRPLGYAGMYLTPTEEDRLAVFTAAQLARRSLADGARLNAPEATALICDEMHRAARRGASTDGVLAAGRSAARAEDVMDGVASLVPEIRLEVLMDDGTRLVVLREPWSGP